MRTLTVAALQTAPLDHDLEGTWERFAGAVESVRHTFPQAGLVLAPELHLSAAGHPLHERDGWMQEAAVTVPGPLTERLGALARATGLWLVPGTVYERRGDVIQNTALVVSPQGELVDAYRKCFPWQPYETSMPGRRLVTFDVPGAGRIGLAICHDGTFPEVPRQLAWSGAEAILQPALTSTADREAEVVVARASAIVNQVAMLSLNAASPAGTGRSVHVGPEGEVRWEAGAGEEVLVDVIDFDAVARVREHGSFGMNRLWDEFDRLAPGLELPMYGRLRPRPSRTDAVQEVAR
jgi:predicted amidohydrolase